MKRFLMLLAFVMVICTAVNAQYSTTNKKAIATFEEALGKYASQSYTEAIGLCDKCIKTDANFYEPYLLKAEIAAAKLEYKEEITYLKSALQLQPKDATILSGLGDAYFELSDYNEAINYYNQALKTERISEKLQKHAQRNIETANFRIYALSHPLDINPKNLGQNVNTEYNEYFPALSADGNTLVYTIELPQRVSNPLLPVSQEDIFITKRTDNDAQWQQAKSIGANINTYNNEGAPFLSADGKILLFTSCTCPDGMIKCCDIYYSYLTNNGFTNARAIPAPVNTNYWESQPAFSADNKVLYFVSNRPGGFGGKDIWYCELTENGKWSEPKNAGENVNTKGDESSPFIHADNQTLYFASDGHIGMGGQDLFVSHLQEDGTWGKAQNLGYPINTKGNETRLAVSVFGNSAIISSDREGKTKLDLYEIQLPKSIQPKRTLLVKGLVKDNKSGKPIKANYEVSDVNDNKKIQNGSTDTDYINLMLYLPEGNDYALNVNADGYLMNSMNFSLKNIPDNITVKYIEIGLDKILVGNIVTLENIFFDTDKYELKRESYYELNKLIDFLQENPSIKIEIGGHTDNSGSEPHNIELSRNRAQSIVKYLTEHKISSTRLSAKGYGSSKPCVPNDSKENMAKNRRTEIKITE
ncbi:MAG: PD40 domain-containing protein [Bacteroidales bacterium]|nr:PD40 domain-containing protein [Bacteroidales bacterium]